jgi:hypothetical protein
MKRTKLWWGGLAAEERRELHFIENFNMLDYEDEWFRPCDLDNMVIHRDKFIAKADNAVLEHERSQNENPQFGMGHSEFYPRGDGCLKRT